MQGTTQNTTESIHSKGGASQNRNTTPETLTPGTITPPGEQSYRYASGRAFVSFVISITALPVIWVLFTQLIELTNIHIDRFSFPLYIMQFGSLLAMGLGITGFVLGTQGLRECNRTPGLKGLTPAITGAILSSITVIIALITTVLTIKFTLESL